MTNKRTGLEPALSQPPPSDAPALSKKRITQQRNDIRQAVIDRANNCCEECHVASGAIGARDRHGEWHDENSIHHMQSDHGYSLFGYEFPNMVKIVLVCVRIVPDNGSGEDNLRALCQRCALNHMRAANLERIREAIRRKRLERQRQKAQDIGQGMMEL